MKALAWLWAIVSYPVELLVNGFCWAVDTIFFTWHNRRGKRK